MNGVLIAAHGSRAKETQATLEEVVARVKAQLQDMEIEIGYMEFCKPNIDDGLTMLMEKGATNIRVIPYFLFDGIHIKEDIPNEIKSFCEKNSGVTVTMGETLGTDKRLSDILVDRIVK